MTPSGEICVSAATATSTSIAMVVNATVTPSVATAITTGSQTTCAGASVTFTATPTNGGTTPTYQWKKGGINISGATNATYTSTTLANGDALTCVMTPSPEICVSATTATSTGITMVVNATLTPSVLTAITTGSPTICVGTSVTFTATPTNGGTTPTYQWKKGGTNISGATSATYTSTALANTDVLTCVMTPSSEICVSAATATSTGITMVVNANPIAYTVIGGGSYCASGSGIAIGLSNSETGVTYQLKLGGVNTGTAVSGTGSALSFGNKTVVGTYTVVATKTTGSCTEMMTGSAVVSQTTTLTPSVLTAITTGNQTICAGTSVTFTATPTNGGTTPTYQWQKGGTNISGATNATYTSTTLANGDVLTCLITPSNEICVSPTTATSTGITMVVNATLTPSVSTAITTGSQTICASSSVTFTATPLNGGTTPTYQWKKGGTNISGATSASYTSTTLANGDAITCVMTPSTEICVSATTATSTGITMVVNPTFTPSVATAITTGSQTICAGTSVTFTATPTNGGTTPTYQWKKGGTNISGATNATYTSTTFANADAITCVMTPSTEICASAATATSTGMTMVVNPTFTPSVATAITTGSQTICAGTSVTFTATPTNGGTMPTYQWKKGGTNISGATGATTQAPL